MLVLGVILLMDGFAKWKERYEEDREFQRELHKKRMESIKILPTTNIDEDK